MGRIQYENFEEIKQEEPWLAEQILSAKGEGEWQNNEIVAFDDTESFAEHELYDGWYAPLNLEDRDYNGAPRLGDFVDLQGLGEALIRNWDDSCNYHASDDTILTTSIGW